MPDTYGGMILEDKLEIIEKKFLSMLPGPYFIDDLSVVIGSPGSVGSSDP